MPRSMSLAPSSRITASVPSGTDQSSRARPPELVSPDTPALAISTASPLALSARSSCTGKAALRRKLKAGGQRIAERHHLDRPLGRAHRARHPCQATSRRSPTRPQAAGPYGPSFPYERGADSRTDAGIRSHERHLHCGKPCCAGPAIALSGVNLSLGRAAARVHILKDIDLHIGRGEAIGLVGPSGSGKTTLLMVLAGLERADTGSIMVAGSDLRQLDEDALARFRGRNVGIVFQSFHLIPTMTALENVAVPLELAGAADAVRRARDELAKVGLAERLHHYPAQLSGGEQQRVALARALAPNPAILVADEPTGNLDEATGKQVIDLLFAGHVERGTTLILVTHDNALAQRCDRIVRLRSGRIEGAQPRRRRAERSHDATSSPTPRTACRCGSSSPTRRS